MLAIKKIIEILVRLSGGFFLFYAGGVHEYLWKSLLMGTIGYTFILFSIDIREYKRKK